MLFKEIAGMSVLLVGKGVGNTDMKRENLFCDRSISFIGVEFNRRCPSFSKGMSS